MSNLNKRVQGALKAATAYNGELADVLTRMVIAQPKTRPHAAAIKPEPTVVEHKLKTRRTRRSSRIDMYAPITILLTDINKSGIRVGTDRWHKIKWVLDNQPKRLCDVLGKSYLPGKVLGMDSINGMIERNHIRLGN